MVSTRPASCAPTGESSVGLILPTRSVLSALLSSPGAHYQFLRSEKRWDRVDGKRERKDLKIEHRNGGSLTIGGFE